MILDSTRGPNIVAAADRPGRPDGQPFALSSLLFSFDLGVWSPDSQPCDLFGKMTIAVALLIPLGFRLETLRSANCMLPFPFDLGVWSHLF